jgi:hypothetical protein
VDQSSKAGLAARPLIVGLVVVLGVLAYVYWSRMRGPGTMGVAACSVSSDSVRRLTRSEFLGWARRLAYESQDTTRAKAYGFDPAAGVRVEAARGMSSATRRDLGDGCLIARVFSNRADTSVGLGVGWTFVWADSSSPYTASFIPEDGSPVVGQNMSIEPSAPSDASVASPKHICSQCGNDWCVYPRDTLRSEPVLFAPEGDTGLRDILEGRTVSQSWAAAFSP